MAEFSIFIYTEGEFAIHDRTLKRVDGESFTYLLNSQSLVVRDIDAFPRLPAKSLELFVKGHEVSFPENKDLWKITIRPQKNILHIAQCTTHKVGIQMHSEVLLYITESLNLRELTIVNPDTDQEFFLPRGVSRSYRGRYLINGELQKLHRSGCNTNENIKIEVQKGF